MPERPPLGSWCLTTPAAFAYSFPGRWRPFQWAAVGKLRPPVQELAARLWALCDKTTFRKIAVFKGKVVLKRADIKDSIKRQSQSGVKYGVKRAGQTYKRVNLTFVTV